MILSEQVKNKIIEILDSPEFMNNLYIDGNGQPLDEETRTELGQFYTPGKICIQMIEKFNFDSLAGKNILDPTVGSGNLLIACLIAGADTDKVFGNEYDNKVIPTCRHRIKRALELLGRDTNEFKDWQIHQGNALHEFALTYFAEDYEQYYFDDTIMPAARQKRLDNLKEVKLVGSINLTECKHDYNIFNSKSFKEKHPDDFNDYMDRQAKRIEREREAIAEEQFNCWKF